MICYSTNDHLIESKSQVTEQNSLFLNFIPNFQFNKKKDSKQTTVYRVNGVNILNRKNLDTSTVIERIQRRKENHNHIEKRRRSTMNGIIRDLSKIIPGVSPLEQKINKANVLKQALAHILDLQAQNRAIREQLEYQSAKQKDVNVSHFPHIYPNHALQPTHIYQSRSQPLPLTHPITFKPYSSQPYTTFIHHYSQ
ncbi:hypothetical protein G6F62_008332 [Rhizopus arrhizus]|nr:hypothetical protein G6F62_008332 [Rhizopus arrhizus]KAG1372434.1 hypothetical protein G6F61_011060 [Rhizopus arrhizus]